MPVNRKIVRTYSKSAPVCVVEEKNNDFDNLLPPSRRNSSFSEPSYSDVDTSSVNAVDNDKFSPSTRAPLGNCSRARNANSEHDTSYLSSPAVRGKKPSVTKASDLDEFSQESYKTSSDPNSGGNSNESREKKNHKGKEKKNNKENKPPSSLVQVNSDYVSSNGEIEKEERRSSNKDVSKKKSRKGRKKKRNDPIESPATASSVQRKPVVTVTDFSRNITCRKNNLNRNNLRPSSADLSASSVNSNSNDSYSHSSSKATDNFSDNKLKVMNTASPFSAFSDVNSSIDESTKSRKRNQSRKNSTIDSGPETSETSSKANSISISSSSCNLSNFSAGLETAESQTPQRKYRQKNDQRYSNQDESRRCLSAGARRLSTANRTNDHALQNTEILSTGMSPANVSSNSPCDFENKSYSSALALDTDSISEMTCSMHEMSLSAPKNARRSMSTPNKSDDFSSSNQPAGDLYLSPFEASPVLPDDEPKEKNLCSVNDSSESILTGCKSVNDSLGAPTSMGEDSMVEIAVSPPVEGSSASDRDVNKSTSLVSDTESSTKLNLKRNEVKILRSSKPKPLRNENDLTIKRKDNRGEEPVVAGMKAAVSSQVAQPQFQIFEESVVKSSGNASEFQGLPQPQSLICDEHVTRNPPKGKEKGRAKFEETALKPQSLICDKSVVGNSNGGFKSEESVSTEGPAETIFKKPPVCVVKPFKKPPIKGVACPLIPPIPEDTVLENSFNTRPSVAPHSKKSIAFKNDSLFADISCMNYSTAGCNSLYLETGKLWRRSLFKAKRESQFFEHSRFHESGIDRTKILEETVTEDPTNCTVRESKGLLTLEDLLIDVSPREYTLMRCGQTETISFGELFPDESLKGCTKLGEGVFGEVFLLGPSEGNCVIKIIPIEGDQKVNDEHQKKFEQVLSEIITAQELSNLRHTSRNITSGFNEVLDCKCVIGEYPLQLINQWNVYCVEKQTYNDCPDMFDENQMYIVLKLGNAGRDLECFEFTSAFQSYSAFLQIGLALAVAEASLEFEHRDLHWGNVLLAPTKEKMVTFYLNDIEYTLPTHGIIATIIDFTLSRVNFKDKETNYTVYFNLGQDPELFQSEGDYQFDMYRMMKKEVQDEWYVFRPHNNIIWLHYVVDKMIKECRYKNTKAHTHKKYMNLLKEFHEKILECPDCVNFVESFQDVYCREYCE